MFIVFPPVDTLPPAVPSSSPSNFTLAPQSGIPTGLAFQAPGSLPIGTAPMTPNQWLLGAFQPQSTGFGTQAGPYPLPSFPIVNPPVPPVGTSIPPFIPLGLAA